MSSVYTGLYVQRLSNGDIFSVQVVDTTGLEMAYDPILYVQKCIQPPIDQLPDLKDFRSVE